MIRFLFVLVLVFGLAFAFAQGFVSDDLMTMTGENGVPYFCDWTSGEFKCGRFGITDVSELISSDVLLAEGAQVIPFDAQVITDGYVWKFDTGPSEPAVIVTHENGDRQRFMYSIWLRNVYSQD